MPVYFIVDITPVNHEGYQDYISQAPAMVNAVGGKYLVRGGEPQTVEGEWTPSRIVIVEFPDEAAFRKLYNDPAYRAILPKRLQNTHSHAILVQGAPPIV